MVLSSIDELKKYFSPLMGRAEHHAKMVDEVVLSLMGAIIATKDEGTDIQVRERNGHAANLLWVYINGHRYAFCYTHGEDSSENCIEMRDRTIQGEVVFTFTNKTTPAEVLGIFKSVNPQAFAFVSQ